MRRRSPRVSPVRTGAIALVVVIAGVYLGFTKSIPFRSHYEVKAAFRSANNLRPNAPVRIAGVEVGKVVSVSRAHPGDPGAIVTMRIADNGRPLHADATFKIRPRIFLEGNFFVDATAGSPSGEEVADGHTFPVNQTATPVQLDQILTALQSDTRADLQSFLREYSTALSGRGGKGYNASIPYMAPAYRDSAIVNEAALGEAEHDLSGYIDKAGVVAGALDRHRVQLKSLVTDFNTTAAALAREDGNLGAAIAELPRTLRVGQPALRALNDSFPSLRGLARDLRPGVHSSGLTLDVAQPLVHQLRGLVSEPELRGLTRDLRPTVPALARLTHDGVPLNREIRQSASCQNEVVLPWSHDQIQDANFPTHGQVYTQLPKAFPGLAGESRSGDANGQWFRVLASAGTNLVTLRPGVFSTTALPIEGTNPPKPQGRPPLRADVPCETQQPPDLRSKVGAPPEQRQIDTSSPAYKLRYAKARATAIDWLKHQLGSEHLDGLLKVDDKDATQQLIDRVAAQAGAKQP